MRRILILAGCAVLALFAVQGCEKGPSGPKAPQLSTIRVNQDRIGLGQQVVFSVEDTVRMSGNPYLLQPVWTINGNQVLQDFTHYDYSGGRGSYLCYYTPSAIGPMDVRLEVYMIFNDAPAGSAEQTVFAERRLNVEKCDARNSFWGDSVAVTMHREPGLVASGTDGVYIGTGYSSILGVSSIVPSVSLVYTFENDSLIRISENFRATADAADGYKYVASLFEFALRTLETEYVGTSSRKVIAATDDRQYLDAANKFVGAGTLTDEELTCLGEGMVKGLVRIEATMYSASTDVVFTTEAAPDSNCAYIVLTYSAK
ncbi:MAG TPA: hypothetical protein IAC03_04130 [Candidatus Coprenecus pullistercoris]|nr:hypothetical protein [Candidatus Coprenecus pullistercoris]